MPNLPHPSSSPHHFRLRAIVVSLLAFGAALVIGRAPTSQHYALCSPGRKIYTVDTAHPNVECIVVSNTTITDVGDLGEHHSVPLRLLSDRLSWRSGHQSALALAPYTQQRRQLSNTMATQLLAALATHLVFGTQ